MKIKLEFNNREFGDIIKNYYDKDDLFVSNIYCGEMWYENIENQYDRFNRRINVDDTIQFPIKFVETNGETGTINKLQLMEILRMYIYKKLNLNVIIKDFKFYLVVDDASHEKLILGVRCPPGKIRGNVFLEIETEEINNDYRNEKYIKLEFM